MASASGAGRLRPRTASDAEAAGEPRPGQCWVKDIERG